MAKPVGKKRMHISKELRRELLIECGFQCSVPRCGAQWPTLHFHHIDENPGNSTAKNILVLCPTHHQNVTSKHIDRKSCELLKKTLAAFFDVGEDHLSAERNRLLYTLLSELYFNLNVLSDEKFTLEQSSFTFYPRLLHIVCDNALSASLFIARQDITLYKSLFRWAEVCRGFNHRLDLTEYRLANNPNLTEARIWHEKLTTGLTIQSVRENIMALVTHLIDHYGEDCGIDYDTVLFEEAEVEEGRRRE